MNSFNFAAKGIEREIARQIEIYEAGGEVRAGDAALRPGARGLAAAALEGGGAGLPLLPRARPRAGAPARGARRAAARARSASCRRRGSAASRRRCRSTTPTCSSRAASTGCGRRVVDAGADPKETANVLANAFVATGVAPDARRTRPSSRSSSSARAEIPRAAFDEALAHSATTASAPSRTWRRRSSPTSGELDPVIDARHRREPGPGRAVPRRQAGPARLLRRPGDEGDRRHGRPARRQRAGAREARRVIRLRGVWQRAGRVDGYAQACRARGRSLAGARSQAVRGASARSRLESSRPVQGSLHQMDDMSPKLGLRSPDPACSSGA